MMLLDLELFTIFSVLHDYIRESILLSPVPLSKFMMFAFLIRDLTCCDSKCYELRSLGLDNRITLVLSNTRELNRDPFTN